jgi:threonine dehydrogenase-like Zn-dependent dehydrogenase
LECEAYYGAPADFPKAPVRACGPIGALLVIAARRAGAAQIVVTHLRAYSPTKALQVDAEEAINVALRPRADLHMQGLFLLYDRMIKFYALDEINQAISVSESGATIKAIVRVPHP